MVEGIVSLANWLSPSLNWSFEDGYKIEGLILGNLYVIVFIGFIIVLIMVIVSYFKDKETESPELVATKILSGRIDILIEQQKKLVKSIDSLIQEIKRDRDKK